MPRTAQRKKVQNPWVLFATLFNLIAVPVAGGAVWLLTKTYQAGDTIATRPYVDERFIQAKLYTGEKAATILKEAFEHSDKNRSDMMLSQEKANSEIQKMLVENTTKTNLVLEAVKSMRDEAWISRPRKR